MIWAVHISAFVLTGPWIVGGFVGMVILIAIGLWRISEDEIPRVGLLTAVFFIASSIHLPVGGITSVHLVLNGLVGVVLGRRAAAAIPAGLLLQAALLGHGDLSTWGINSCIMTIPALLAGPMLRSALKSQRHGVAEATLALSWCLYPWSLVVIAPLTFAEKRLQTTIEFRGGFAVGFVTVFISAILNSLVLALGGIENWAPVAWLTLAVHLPVAIVEGFVVGSVVKLLLRVKPELLQANRRRELIQAEKSHPSALPIAPVPR
jgi:cobalt/nickel transport system permease protein